MDNARQVISPQPAKAGDDRPYYRNVELSVRDGEFTLVDASGRASHVPAEVIAWVSAGTAAPRLLLLGADGVVLAELPTEGWDVEALADFGDAIGVPLVRESYPDALAARAARPLPKGAVRVHATELKAVVLQFLPVLVPVLVVIVLVLVLS